MQVSPNELEAETRLHRNALIASGIWVLVLEL